MGEEVMTAEVGEAVANGSVSPTKPDCVVKEKKDGEKEVVEEMCKDTKDDENVDKEDAEISKDAKEGEEKELNGSKEEGKDKWKEETKSEAMEVDDEENANEQSESKIAEVKEEEDKVEEVGSKKYATKKGGREKGNSKKETEEKKVKEKREEPKTPVARTIDRPVRERKSVERLVAVIEKDTAREFHIEKGRGTALKDIPNVAYKLSKKKVADDALKLLHTVLFGRRGKALLVKSNILRFSGFVWHENEEKQKAKLLEKLYKCNKEKLFEFCDLLDIPIAKTTAKKEDVVVKLIDFLLLPHITTSELLSEKEQPSTGSKRKRPSKKSASTSGVTPSKDSSKKQKSKSASKEREGNPDTEGSEEQEEEEEKSNEHQKVNGGPEKSGSENSEHTESEGHVSESESGEDSKKRKRGSKKSSSKKDSASKNKLKPKKSSPQKKTPTESSANRSKSKDQGEPSPKTFSRKKKIDEVEDKPSTPKKSASKEKTGKKAVKGKEKLIEEKQKPSDDELKAAVYEILKEVDFNTATFTDILKLLGKRFNTDLTPRKATIKLMIQDELTKLADAADDEEGEADKSGKEATATKA